MYAIAFFILLSASLCMGGYLLLRFLLLSQCIELGIGWRGRGRGWGWWLVVLWLGIWVVDYVWVHYLFLRLKSLLAIIYYFKFVCRGPVIINFIKYKMHNGLLTQLIFSSLFRYFHFPEYWIFISIPTSLNFFN